ncbi:DDE superfamily endonuclease-domain-containing protein [Chytridium lagenaria]|nr:DDE superfamily endonuclease-domain-containing protein [Chytridium lagenaria]
MNPQQLQHAQLQLSQLTPQQLQHQAQQAHHHIQQQVQHAAMHQAPHPQQVPSHPLQLHTQQQIQQQAQQLHQQAIRQRQTRFLQQTMTRSLLPPSPPPPNPGPSTPPSAAAEPCMPDDNPHIATITTTTTSTTTKRKLQTMDIQQKEWLLSYSREKECVNQKILASVFASRWGWTPSQPAISRLLRQPEITEADEAPANKSVKRKRAVAYPEVEKALADWFREYQDRTPISGDMLKEKGREILEMFHPGETFEFSNGWLDKFKVRHGIKSLKRFVEGDGSMFVDGEGVTALREALGKYQWRDIFVVGEMGMFYKYRWNGLGGMTTGMFNEWLRWFDDKMMGRRVALVMNDSALHQISMGLVLKNVEVYALPPGSNMNPLDVGIIGTFKALYWRKVVNRIMVGLDVGEETLDRITVVDAVEMMKASWHLEVKIETIRNSFRYCRIREESHLAAVIAPSTQMEGIIQSTGLLSSSVKALNLMDARRFVTFDYIELPTEEELLEAERRWGDGFDEGCPDDDDIEQSLWPVTSREAVFYLRGLRNDIPAVMAPRRPPVKKSSVPTPKIKLRCHFGDTRIIQITPTVTYDELTMLVQKKFASPTPLKLQYKDSDGCLILISDEEDLEVAFDGFLRGQNGREPGVTRFEIWCSL